VTTLLQLHGVDKIFGGLHALRDVSLSVESGAIFGLIGPNGAGKTTLFNVITGIYRPDRGRVVFVDKDISGFGTARVAEAGVARTFQNIRLFRAMTVEENVMVAGQHLDSSGLWGSMFRTARFAVSESALRKRAHELLDVLGLLQQSADVAGSLPYGMQRRLEIARALMLAPRLLLLDEPAAGMNSREAMELVRQIRFLRDEFALTIVLVEHNMSVVLNVCETIHVLDLGSSIASGSPAEIRVHPKVLAAYLGKADATAEATP
jgi:branched-chain amino acid transport system ATP-binding protein